MPADKPEEDRPLTDREQRLGLDKGDFYYSEEGFIVFTEQYHQKRGHCCQSGCRHCPYDYKGKLRRGEL